MERMLNEFLKRSRLVPFAFHKTVEEATLLLSSGVSSGALSSWETAGVCFAVRFLAQARQHNFCTRGICDIVDQAALRTATAHCSHRNTGGGGGMPVLFVVPFIPFSGPWGSTPLPGTESGSWHTGSDPSPPSRTSYSMRGEPAELFLSHGQGGGVHPGTALGGPTLPS